MELDSRKNQFLIFTVLLTTIGLLQYFRKIASGMQLSKIGKVLYLSTMLIFTISIMFVLYYTKLNNLISFGIGLSVAMLSEHIAKLFIVFGNNFNVIIAKAIKKTTGIDIQKELKELENGNNK